MTAEQIATLKDQIHAVCELVQARRLSIDAASHAILALLPPASKIKALIDAIEPIARETRDYDGYTPEALASGFPGAGVVVSVFDIYRARAARDDLAKMLEAEDG